MTLDFFLVNVLRCAFFLAVASVLVKTLLRITRCQSSMIHRLAWFIVLFLGIVWVHHRVKVPVLEPVAKIEQNPMPVDTEMPDFSFEYIPTTALSQFDTAKEIFVERELEPVPMEIPIVAASSVAEPDFGVEEILPQEKSDVNIPLTHIFFAVWIFGIFVLLTFKGFVYVRLLQKLRRAVSPTESDVAAFELLLAESGISRKARIRILLTQQIGPALARIPGRHVIAVPKSLWEEANEEIRRGILLHEISHYRHRDDVKSFFAWLLAVVQWFNPAAWFALKRFHDAAEWRCDAEAYGNREESLAVFAESLLMLHKTGDRYVGVLQSFRLQTFGRGELMERIEKLTEHQTQRKESPMKHFCLLTGLALLLTTGMLRIELVAKDAESEMAVSKENITETETEELQIITEDNTDDTSEENLSLTALESRRRAEYFQARERYDQFMADMPSEKNAALSDEYKTLSNAVDTTRKKWEHAEGLRDISGEEQIQKDIRKFVSKKVDLKRAEGLLKHYQKLDGYSTNRPEKIKEAKKEVAEVRLQLTRLKEVLLKQLEMTKSRFEVFKREITLLEKRRASTGELDDAKNRFAILEQWLQKTEEKIHLLVDNFDDWHPFRKTEPLIKVTSGAEKRILQKLEEPFLFDFKDATTFYSVVTNIQKETGLTFFADWRALQEIGINYDTPTKLRLPGMMPLKDVLQYLEKQLGVTWVVENEALYITVPKAKGQYCATIYYVGDLLKSATKEPLYDANGKPLVTSVAVSQDAFEPVIDYIKTMVAPESWSTEENKTGADITIYYHNLCLIIRHNKEGHLQIAELLSNLRKYNDIQISFDVKMRVISRERVLNDEKPSRVRITLFSGGVGGTCRPEADVSYFVQLTPFSGKAVPPELAAENEPFEFIVPKGSQWSVKAKAMNRDGNDIIVATVFIDDENPRTRTFFASPVNEEEAYMLDGSITPQQIPKDEEVVQRVYDISDFLDQNKRDAATLVHLIQTVTGDPLSWGTDRVGVTPQETKLLINQLPSIHAEIDDLFKQLRKLDRLQIRLEVSVLRVTPQQTSGEDDQWNSAVTSMETMFNGQTQEIKLGADSEHLVRIRPEKSTRLARYQEEFIIPVGQGAKLFIQGIVSDDQEHILLIVSDGVKKPTKEGKLFHAKPILMEEALKKYAVGDTVTVSVIKEKVFTLGTSPDENEQYGTPWFIITCQVTEIHEDGRLTLEGIETVRIGEIKETVHVTGIVTPTAIQDGKIESRHLENLTIKVLPVSAEKTRI